MVHEFNDNGYVYTERELHSGKYYKIIMKKAYDISYYHNKKAERYNKLKQMLQTSQMQITNDMPVKESHSDAKNITEKNNIKSQKIDFIQDLDQLREKYQAETNRILFKNQNNDWNIPKHAFQ